MLCVILRCPPNAERINQDNAPVIGPRALDAIEPLVSMSGASATTAASAVPPNSTAGLGCTAVRASVPSHVAAPITQCVCPIMIKAFPLLVQSAHRPIRQP